MDDILALAFIRSISGLDNVFNHSETAACFSLDSLIKSSLGYQRRSTPVLGHLLLRTFPPTYLGGPLAPPEPPWLPSPRLRLPWRFPPVAAEIVAFKVSEELDFFSALTPWSIRNWLQTAKSLSWFCWLRATAERAAWSCASPPALMESRNNLTNSVSSGTWHDIPLLWHSCKAVRAAVNLVICSWSLCFESGFHLAWVYRKSRAVFTWFSR